MMPPLTAIGRIVRTHGVEGEVSVAFDVENIDPLLAASHCVMLYDEGLPVPFFISGIRSRGARSRLLKFDDVNSESEAAVFVGKDVCLPADLVAEYEEDDDNPDGLYAGDLIGFTVIDHDTQAQIGTIADIDEQTENALFVVDTSRGEVLIPIADEYITGVYADSRTITLSLPNGLI